jgi:hypothetical protein
MIPMNMQKIAELAARLRLVLLATVDDRGLPHMAVADKLSLISEQYVEVAGWFCPGTVTNLEQNRGIALVVWDAAEDIGYQLVGEVEQMEEIAFLNGYLREEGQTPSPHVERRLRVHVGKIIAFTHAPHSDVEQYNGLRAAV